MQIGETTGKSGVVDFRGSIRPKGPSERMVRRGVPHQGQQRQARMTHAPQVSGHSFTWLVGWLVASSLCVSGCAIYDPWQIWHFRLDYNTERQWSAQFAVSDHLPPKPLRVKRIRWRYNSGTPELAGAVCLPPETVLPPDTSTLPEPPLPGSGMPELRPPAASPNYPAALISLNNTAGQPATGASAPAQPLAPQGAWLFSRPQPTGSALP